MADAKKCDRCGYFWIPDDSSSDEENVQIIRVIKVKPTIVLASPSTSSVDLCNHCQSALTNWFKNNKIDDIYKKTRTISAEYRGSSFFTNGIAHGDIYLLTITYNPKSPVIEVQVSGIDKKLIYIDEQHYLMDWEEINF